jgi:hypothetical protein
MEIALSVSGSICIFENVVQGFVLFKIFLVSSNVVAPIARNFHVPMLVLFAASIAPSPPLSAYKRVNFVNK